MLLFMKREGMKHSHAPWRQISSNKYKSTKICFPYPVWSKDICISRRKSKYYFISLSLSNSSFESIRPSTNQPCSSFPPEIKLKILHAFLVALLKALPLPHSCALDLAAFSHHECSEASRSLQPPSSSFPNK